MALTRARTRGGDGAVEVEADGGADRAHGGEAGMLADHHLVAAPEQRGVEALVGAHVGEQTGDVDAGFMRKNVGADDRLGAGD